MKLYFLIIILIFGCTNTNESNEIKNIKLDESLASELISLSTKCVDKKYPYKICLLYTSDAADD